jgi:hypothetical protein
MGIGKKGAQKRSWKAEPLEIRLFVIALFVAVLLCGGLLVPILWTALIESMQCRTDQQACNLVHRPKTLHDSYK